LSLALGLLDQLRPIGFRRRPLASNTGGNREAIGDFDANAIATQRNQVLATGLLSLSLPALSNLFLAQLFCFG